MTDIEKRYRLKKAKTHKGRLHLESQMPKVFEDPKNCVLINTNNSSELMRLVLNEFYLSRKSFSTKLQRKNIINSVFDKTDDIEKLAGYSNSSLFSYTSDNKKRPMNLVLGNLFNKKILDAFEFEVTNFIPQEYFEDVLLKFNVNSTPIIIFVGEQFETEKTLERFKKYIMDFYRQDQLKEVNISDLRRVISVVYDSEEQKIKIRNYQINIPITEYNYKLFSSTSEEASKIIEEVGPSFDLKPRRNLLASDDEYKLALKQPKLISGENKKLKQNSLMYVKAKIFPAKQNLNALSLKRYDKLLGKKRNKEESKEKNATKEESNEKNTIKGERRGRSKQNEKSKSKGKVKQGRASKDKKHEDI